MRGLARVDDGSGLMDWRMLCVRSFYQPRQNASVVKDFGSKIPCRPAVSLIATVDRLDSTQYLVLDAERKETRTRRQPVGESRLLGDHRPSARQVDGASFTEPPAAADNVTVFGDCKLTLGPLNVFLIGPRVAAWTKRI